MNRMGKYTKYFLFLFFLAVSCRTGYYHLIREIDKTGRYASIEIIYPGKDMNVVNRTQITISGTAHDYAGIGRVAMTINDKPVQVSGKEAWNAAAVPLSFGPNGITIQIISADGIISAEKKIVLYNTLTNLREMNRGRSNFAVAGDDRYIYISGGTDLENGETVIPGTIDVYDTLTNSFVKTYQMHTPLYAHSLLLFNNKLYIAGGVNDTGNASSACYSINLADGFMQFYAPLPEICLSSTLFYYNHAFILSPGTGKKAIYQYNIDANTWVKLYPPDLSKPGNYKPAALLVSNMLYLMGGFNPDTNTMDNRVFAFNLDTQVMNNLMAPLPVPVQDAKAVFYRNNFFLFGGNSNGESLNTVYAYPLAGQGELRQWKAGAGLPFKVYDGCIFRINDDIYILGGKRIYEEISGDFIQNFAASKQIDLYRAYYDPCFQ